MITIKIETKNADDYTDVLKNVAHDLLSGYNESANGYGFNDEDREDEYTYFYKVSYEEKG